MLLSLKKQVYKNSLFSYDKVNKTFTYVKIHINANASGEICPQRRGCNARILSLVWLVYLKLDLAKLETLQERTGRMINLKKHRGNYFAFLS